MAFCRKAAVWIIAFCRRVYCLDYGFLQEGLLPGLWLFAGGAAVRTMALCRRNPGENSGDPTL